MSNERILAVDDETPILELLRYNLEKEGFRITTCASGEEAIRILRADELPDIVLLDLMLPGMSGLDVCRKMKENPVTAGIPVIMLTARTEDTDVVLGLELGAEDYITKPFSPRVLMARVRTVLRRKARKPVMPEGERTSIHNIEIDPVRHEVFSCSVPIPLSVTEFQIHVPKSSVL
jgi:two-component system phosphate regulon response regulator PhoB